MNNCSIEANQKATDVSERKKKPWNKEKKSLIEKLTAEKHRRMRQVRKLRETGQLEAVASNSQRLAEIEELIVRNAGDLIQLDPSQYDKWASLLNAKLGWRKKNPLNPSLNYSQAGEVREALKDARRVAQNLVDDASHIRMLDGVKRFHDVYNEVLKPYGITPEDARSLFNETLEVGSIPKNNGIYGGEGVQLINTMRYNDYIEHAKSLGLTDDNIDTLTRAAADVHAVFDEMRLIAEATGHNIEELTNLGYFPRIATRDFNIRLRKALETDTALADVIMSDGVEQVKMLNPLSSAWQKSRKFNYFVPSDLDVAAQLFDTTTDEISEMLLNPREWMEFLNSSITSSQLDTLVELGQLEKLPMTSREVFEYMVDQYELPYKHISEMFKQDPHVAAEEYARVLKQAVGNSAMVQTVAREGTQAGWALTTKQVNELTPTERANFVPLQFLKLDEFLPPEQIEAMGKLYVHKVVRDQWRSMLEISMSPAKIGAFAKYWHYFASFMNKSILASRNILYVGTNFLSGFVLTNAVGGNIATIPHAMMDMMRYIDRGLDAFDNTKPFAKLDGEWLTKREFFQGFILRRGTDITPGTVNADVANNANPFASFGSILNLFDVRSAKRAMEYMFSYAKSFGDPLRGAGGVASYAGSLINEATDNFFAPFAKMAVFLDTMYKWNAYTSLVERSGSAQVANNIARAATLEPLTSVNKTFTSWRDLIRHVDDYFFTFDDPGTTTRFVSRYIRPFASWAMQSTPAMLRYALRRPQKFMNYVRLTQVYNRDRNNGEALPQAGLTDWQDDEYPIILRRDVLSGDNGLLVLFPHTYDPIADTLNVINSTGQTIERFLGHRFTGNERDKRKAALGKRDSTQEMVNDLFNDTYWAKIASLLTGVDSFTGEKRDNSKPNSYLGVNMSPLAEALLGMYPPLDALNRSNPFGVFGRREYKDYRDNVLIKEQPSWAGAQRTNSDAQTLAWETAVSNRDWGALLMMTLGARVRVIDEAKNIQFTLAEIKTGIDELTKANADATRSLTLNPDKLSPGELEARKKRLIESITAEYQMKYDYARLLQYMKVNGIPPRNILNEMSRRGVDVNSLDPVGGRERLQLESEFRRKLESIDNE